MSLSRSDLDQKLQLVFCKFLLNRVATVNLDVFQQIGIDFSDEPPHFTRLDEVIYRAHPMIAIRPQDILDTVQRAKAEKILLRMREYGAKTDNGGTRNCIHSLGEAIRGRIEVRNWDQLEQIYSDFLRGSDKALRKFVALQPETIAILPVRPYLLQCEQSPSRDSRLTHDNTPYRHDRESYLQRASLHGVCGDVQAIVRAVAAEFQALERTEPWSRVFDIRKITFPFSTHQHPGLAENFKDFWRRGARAVWERNFWCRVPQSQTTEVETARKSRQSEAEYDFVKLIVCPIFATFGPEFFVKLDNEPKREYWWWYRGPPVDLVQMASVTGMDACVQYMRVESTRRDPKPQPQFNLRPHLHPDSGSCMWTTSARAKHVYDAVARLKRCRARSANVASKSKGSRKRNREKDSDSGSEEKD